MLRKLGFFTGFWWVALRDRDAWLGEWIDRRSARIQLFFFRTLTFVAVGGLFAYLLGRAGDSPSLPKLFAAAAAVGTITLWWRSKTWITEYQDIFAGRYD